MEEENEDTGGKKENMVPQSRLDAKNQRIAELEAQLSTVQTQVQQLQTQAASVPGLQAQVQELGGKLSQAEGRYETFRAIATAGISDAELVEAVEWSYGKLPAEGRPALADWLNEIKADPQKAPVVLRPHLQAQGAQGAAQGAQGNQTAQGNQGQAQGQGNRT